VGIFRIVGRGGTGKRMSQAKGCDPYGGKLGRLFNCASRRKLWACKVVLWLCRIATLSDSIKRWCRFNNDGLLMASFVPRLNRKRMFTFNPLEKHLTSFTPLCVFGIHAICRSSVARSARPRGTLSASSQSTYKMTSRYNATGWWARAQEAYRKASGVCRMGEVKMRHVGVRLCAYFYSEPDAYRIHSLLGTADDAEFPTPKWPITARYATAVRYGANAEESRWLPNDIPTDTLPWVGSGV